MLAATRLHLEARRRAGPRRPPRASPGGGRRRSARSPLRRASRAIARPIPLDAPVINAARSAIRISSCSRPPAPYRSPASDGCHAVSNNMPPMRAPRASPALSPACSRRPRRWPAAAVTPTRRLDRGAAAAESRPAPPKSEFPSAEGKTLAEVLEAADGPSELVVVPGGAWSSTRARTATRSASSTATGSQVDRRRSRPLLRQGAASEAEGAKSRAAGTKGAAKARRRRRSTSPRSAPSPPRSKASRPSRPSGPQTTASDPNAATVVYSTQLDFPSDGEWRIAALIKEGDELTATLLPSAVSANSSGSRRPGEKAPVIHTPTAAGRRRRPLEDHHPRSRRTPRTRSITRMRSAKNRSCSCLRPPSSARVGSAAPSSTWPSRSNRTTETRRRSSTWRSTTTTIRARGCAPRCAPSTCRASRGCSRSTARARSATRSRGPSASSS